MLEILQFYVSGFWTWLGITIGLGLVMQGIASLAETIILALRPVYRRAPEERP